MADEWIALTPAQIARATEEGRARQAVAEAGGWVPTYGQTTKDAARAHIEGAQAELAFATAIGSTDWPSPTERPDREIGDVDGWQVRSTIYLRGHLLAHPDDEDDWRLVLVINQSPRFKIAGAMVARDCKRREWWRAGIRHPCFFVPQCALRRPADNDWRQIGGRE